MTFPRLRLSVVAAASVGLLATACGGASAPSDPAVAQQLAASADHIAVLLDAGQLCEARQEADHLIAAAREAQAEGRLADAIATDVVETTVAATADATCAPPELEQQEPAPAPGKDDAPGKSKGKGKKKGKD